MTAEERELLIQLINDPPPGSKIAAAREFGIDLTLAVSQLERTPTERFLNLAAAQSFLEEMRRAGRERRR
ncbi:MAG: hypothetical protein ACLQOO_19355 [Terriglobia bacterium]